VVPYKYKMHFAGMNYGALVSDAAKVLRFTQGIKLRVSLAVDLPIGNIQVGVVVGLGKGVVFVWGGDIGLQCRLDSQARV